MTTRETLITILNILSSIVGIIIGARVIFMLAGANPSTPIVAWINNVSSVLIYPFSGLFQNIFFSQRSVLDITAVIALVVYAIVFSVIYRAIGFISRDEYITEVHSQSHV